MVGLGGRKGGRIGKYGLGYNRVHRSEYIFHLII